MTDSKMLLRFASTVEPLSQTAAPLWGKMSAQEMLEHLVASLRLSQGRFQAERIVPERQAMVMKRRIIESPNPMPKNFDNPIVQKRAPLEFDSVKSAKESFQAELILFYDFFENHLNQNPIHPLFGGLNFWEWEKFHFKHFTHHFTQFGL
jgi:oxepin-CoA hydrolase/3-oxo-5,6-dehydrosuberyl-CoA semialdehyde dehydrogenase